MNLNSSRQRIPGLDGLRGVAILLVIASHVSAPFAGWPADERVVGPVLSGGWIGVDVFFVLSGFLITGILLDAREEAGYFRRFYARRARRILPLYFAFLAGCVIVLPLAWPGLRDQRAYALFGSQKWWYLTFTQNILMASRGTMTAAASFAGHLWSLAVEEQFYILWPIVIFFASTRTVGIIAGVAGVASLALRVAWLATGHQPVGAYVLMPTRMDGLAAGAIIAAALRIPAWRPRFAVLAKPLLVAGLAIILLAFGVRSDAHWDTSTWALVGAPFGAAMATAGVILAITTRSQPALGLDAGWLRLVGKFSYAMYVLHPPLFWLLQKSRLGTIVDNRTPGVALLLARACAYTLIAFLAAACSWYLLERWFVALKRTPRRGDDDQASAATAGLITPEMPPVGISDASPLTVP